MRKKKYDLNEIGNWVKFTKMNDEDRLKLIKTHIIIHGTSQYKYDGRKKKIIKMEVVCN